MLREIKIGAVSWIASEQNPVWFAGKVPLLEPEWIPKTYIGLAATSNDAPPAHIANFRNYEAARDYRAMMYAHVRVDIDDATDRVRRVDMLDAFHNPGFTPPFNQVGWPSRSFILPSLADWSADVWGHQYHAGEASALSLIRGQARHPQSAIGQPVASEQVVANGLIKFRAGAHTDNVGVRKVNSPFHVPWVWCEMLLTYSARRFTLWGCGSIFPTHAWYVNGRQVHKMREVSDSSFPTRGVAQECIVADPVSSTFVFGRPYGPAPVVCVPKPAFQIAIELLNLYPVLSSGAPANGPQPDASADRSSGPVFQHRYTVGRTPTFVESISD